MLCEKILGTLSDPAFDGLRVDYVDIEWHEAFSRLHRKTSAEGEDVGIRMGNEILSTGLNQDDVLYADAEKVIAVNIPACEAIRASVRQDHPRQIAKLCYEVGNTHTSMFRGEDDFTFYTPYHEPLLEKINGIHGVTAEKVMKKFDFRQALSSSINNHHH
ncbi:MAG: urease accessory protein UreE [Lachnospiraceae bacterium]|nr:urease accessory protein UreE [Lachnospiraceae bacterium]